MLCRSEKKLIETYVKTHILEIFSAKYYDCDTGGLIRIFSSHFCNGNCQFEQMPKRKSIGINAFKQWRSQTFFSQKNSHILYLTKGLRCQLFDKSFLFILRLIILSTERSVSTKIQLYQ